MPIAIHRENEVVSQPPSSHVADASLVDAISGAHTNGTKANNWKQVSMSPLVRSIRNPIREVISGIDLSASPSLPSDPKPLINLGLGDPSVFRNLPPPREALDAIETSLRSGLADGYPESVGYKVTREAVANYFDEEWFDGNWRVQAKDVVMTHGASGGLEMVMAVLADESKNVLFPRPLFTAYETLATITKAEIRYYDLLPEKNWEIDLPSLEKVIDENTALLMLNNPSNPCGSNWSESHLRDIAAVATRHQVVVVSDEVYAGMAWSVSSPSTTNSQLPPTPVGKFNRRVFTPYASICGSAPCVTVGAISKRWLAPGWRLGWVIVHDPLDVMSEVREGLGRWAFRIQGPNSTMQRALPSILKDTPEAFFEDTMKILEDVGEALEQRLGQIDGLIPMKPQGAMYFMCGGLTTNFNFKTDTEFVTALHKEENVFILPGKCFRLDGFMRFVTTVPQNKLMDACDRIEEFCKRHRRH